jgi:hypothetical protein
MVNATNYYIDRQLSLAVENVYKTLSYTYKVNYHCYYGAIQFFNADNLLKLVTELNLLVNLAFNVGYMWTDIVMLVLGQPGETETDYAYYVSYYLGDFLFRFLFKETAYG